MDSMLEMFKRQLKLMELAEKEGGISNDGLIGYIPDEVLHAEILKGSFDSSKKEEVSIENIARDILKEHGHLITDVKTVNGITIATVANHGVFTAVLDKEDTFSYSVGVAICLAKGLKLQKELEQLRGYSKKKTRKY